MTLREIRDDLHNRLWRCWHC